jgi:hypothetical protein
MVGASCVAWFFPVSIDRDRRSINIQSVMVDINRDTTQETQRM